LRTGTRVDKVHWDQLRRRRRRGGEQEKTEHDRWKIKASHRSTPIGRHALFAVNAQALEQWFIRKRN
jgi:hypothetical protein